MDNLMDFYDIGIADFHKGKEMWECPFVLSTSEVKAMPAWLAGWMFAKQTESINNGENNG